MKRSEMVDLMYNFINKINQDADRKFNKFDTDDLLAEMEKRGMFECKKRNYRKVCTLWTPEGWDVKSGEDNEV